MAWQRDHLTHTASCPSTYANYYPKADLSYRQYKSWQNQTMIMSSAMVEWQWKYKCGSKQIQTDYACMFCKLTSHWLLHNLYRDLYLKIAKSGDKRNFVIKICLHALHDLDGGRRISSDVRLQWIHSCICVFDWFLAKWPLN